MCFNLTDFVTVYERHWSPIMNQHEATAIAYSITLTSPFNRLFVYLDPGLFVCTVSIYRTISIRRSVGTFPDTRSHVQLVREHSATVN